MQRMKRETDGVLYKVWGLSVSFSCHLFIECCFYVSGCLIFQWRDLVISPMHDNI